uniref:Uncharacterized protein n=1 Tax=Meloidogyne hapla TaxID=6305 RepID=A0A1I8B7F0_MELHA
MFGNLWPFVFFLFTILQKSSVDCGLGRLISGLGRLIKKNEAIMPKGDEAFKPLLSYKEESSTSGCNMVDNKNKLNDYCNSTGTEARFSSFKNATVVRDGIMKKNIKKDINNGFRVGMVICGSLDGLHYEISFS